MTATENPRLRLILLLGLLAAAALGAGMLFLSRSAATSEAADAPLPPLRRASTAPAPAAKPSKPSTVPSQPAAKPSAAQPTTRPKPKAAPTTAPSGLPLPLAVALERHDVVVVSLHVPGAAVDELARAEAEAGAGDVRAGFVALDALDRRHGGPLTAKLGVLEAPVVLVYRRPDTLFVQLDGFVDRETVAQAAADARP